MLFSPDHLKDYLSDHFGKSVTIEGVERFGRGASRETWAVSAAIDGAVSKMVFRLDFPTGSVDPSPLDQEYFMYERLGGTTLPMAKALWWEDDARWTSRPFYVREHIDGNWNLPGFLDPSPEFDDMRIAISKEHLRCLSILHQLDWKALGFDARLPAPKGTSDCASNYIDFIIAQYRDSRGEAVPLILAAAETLRRMGPEASSVCLCKGTNGLGEEVFRDGKIVAMSDWEEASIGDPAADFAFVQNLIPTVFRDGEQVWGMQQALDHYETLTGFRIPIASVDYYKAVRALKAAIFAQKSAQVVHADPSRSEIRHAWSATEVQWFTKKAVGAILGWVDAPPASLLEDLNRSVDQES